jgi:uncharacterized protein YybS (DUF2232 family)
MTLPGRDITFDLIKGGVLTLALFLAYITFPVIGLLPGMFAPLPGIYFYLKRGAVTGIAIFVLTVAVLAAMGEATIPLLYILQTGAISLLLPFFYQQGKGSAKSIAYSVGIVSLLITAVAVGYGLWSGVDLQASLLQGIRTSTDQAVAVYGKQGLSKEDLDLLTSGMRQAGDLIARVFPALLVVSLGSIAALNMSVVFRLAAKYLPELAAPESFLGFRNPEPLVWFLIIAGFSMLVPQPELQRVALNILVLCAFVYFLQGLAIVLAFFRRSGTPPLARGIFWLVLMFQPYLAAAVAVLGIFDIWGDFRTPKQQNL